MRGQGGGALYVAQGTFLWLSTGTEATQELARPAAPASCAVSVSGLRKSFRLPHERHDTIKERLAHPLRRVRHETLTALDDVSASTSRRGEFFGIVGRNGSGKSTLLKCLAGIYGPTRALDVDGRLAPFIELGVGFNPDLSAATTSSSTPSCSASPRARRASASTNRRFAELREVHRPEAEELLLGHAGAAGVRGDVQVDADVLLFDEVLAVGDAGFQQKCFERFERLKSEGRTSCSSRTTWRGGALLRPRDGARRRAARGHRGAGGDRQLVRPPQRRRAPAPALGRRYRAGEPATGRAPLRRPARGAPEPRRPALARAPPGHADPRDVGGRVQAALPRFRAQLPLGDGRAAGALRDPLPRLHQRGQLQPRRAALPAVPAHVDDDVDVLRHGHHGCDLIAGASASRCCASCRFRIL